MKKYNNRWFAIVLSVLIVLPLLAACSTTQKTAQDQKGVLRIAGNFGTNDDYLRQQYTEIFEFAHPNIKIEFVPIIDQSQYMYAKPTSQQDRPDPLENLKKLMEGSNPPDVVMLDTSQLKDLVKNNLLMPLDSLITKDKFDTSDIAPAVMNGVKQASGGDGKLYALAPMFTSSALVFNKKIFDNAGVPYPSEKGMTWNQLFDLAHRVSKPGSNNDQIYGFNFNTRMYGDPFHQFAIYTAPLQLQMYDSKFTKMLVNSKQWAKVWNQFIQLSKQGVIPYNDPQHPFRVNQTAGQYNPFASDLFLSGRLAMSVVTTYDINRIITANKSANNIKGFNKVDWGLVPLPTHAEIPGVGGGVNLIGLMGINAKAQSPNIAWDFLKFVNGKKWAQLKSHSSYQLVSRKEFIKPIDGANYNVQAFTQLSPAPQTNNMSTMQQKYHQIFMINQLGYQLFQQALQGQITVDDALKKWETYGNKMIEEMRKDPNKPVQMPQELFQRPGNKFSNSSGSSTSSVIVK